MFPVSFIQEKVSAYLLNRDPVHPSSVTVYFLEEGTWTGEWRESDKYAPSSQYVLEMHTPASKTSMTVINLKTNITIYKVTHTHIYG